MDSKFLKPSEKFPSSAVPVNIKTYDTTLESFSYNLHWHMEQEILHIIRGSLTITLNGKKIILNQDQFCFIQSGTLHSVEADKKQNCTFESLIFNINFLQNIFTGGENFLQKISNHQVIIKPVISGEDNSLILPLYAVFNSMKKELPGKDFLCVGGLLSFFGALFNSQGFIENEQAANTQAIKKNSQLNDSINFIQKNFDKQITLEDMAASAGVSTKYFCKFFREAIGFTPVNYLNNYRIEKACWLLRTTNDEITQIAMNCGFNNYSYFIRLFGKTKQTTPLKYRNQIELSSQENFLLSDSQIHPELLETMDEKIPMVQKAKNKSGRTSKFGHDTK